MRRDLAYLEDMIAAADTIAKFMLGQIDAILKAEFPDADATLESS